MELRPPRAGRSGGQDEERYLGALIALAACGSEPEVCECEAEGKLGEAGACVDPWMYGSPVWSRCEVEPRATPESRAMTAAAYDARVLGLHARPETPWVVDVVTKPGVDPEIATIADVDAWWSGENDGLFSARVMAAEAYRFAVTRDPAARTALATLLRGGRMDITGVPGRLDARELDLLLEAEETRLFRRLGHPTMAAYMVAELECSRHTANEKLRAAHELIDLPAIAGGFRAGALIWTKVRELTRVATAEPRRNGWMRSRVSTGCACSRWSRAS